MPFSHFDDLESNVEDILNALDKEIPKANSEIFEAFMEFYYSLEKSSNGDVAASVGNLNAINNFKYKIDGLIQNGNYSKSVNKYLNQFSSNSQFINNYFSEVAVNFNKNNSFYNAILEANVSDTANKLLNSGVNANFRDPLIKILRDNVAGGSNKAQFIQTLKNNIIGTKDSPGNLSRYVTQVASDSITQFNSNYIHTVSTDLGLNHYYYKGTKIQDSRPLCSKLAGKYFTEDHLKSIVTNAIPWAGMVKGENWSTFPIYRGGYNCRHYLIPVSQDLYDRSNAKYQG
jgi:hypothetical protein